MAFAKPSHAWSPVNSHKNPTGSRRWSKPHGSTVPKRWCQGWLRCSSPLCSASFPASLCEICPQTGCGGLVHRLFLVVWGKLLPTKVLPHLTVQTDACGSQIPFLGRWHSLCLSCRAICVGIMELSKKGVLASEKLAVCWRNKTSVPQKLYLWSCKVLWLERTWTSGCSR